ncbi:MAG: hypothetical protein JWL77_301 [Chthonomonadaceae bacterium]|nr:hypothetical protein [Chthonomonadaceae bacterium]
MAQLGVKSTVVAEPDANSPAELRDKIKAVNRKLQAVDAVEGPNEPDLFWVKNKKTYQGQRFPEGVVHFQKDLYAALKSDPATAKLTVIGPALGKTYDPGGGSPNPFTSGLLADSVDWGNFHPYPGGNPFSVPFPYGTLTKYYWFGTFPSADLDEFPYALHTYSPPFTPKPMCATETGYSTFSDGQSEVIHAKYMPRLFAEYFRLGIQRAYSYEFIDEFADAAGANREAHFGLLRRDLTPKPAYTAIRNLIHLLDDSKGKKGFQPGKLDFRIDVQPSGEYTKTQFVHHLLLQKSDGDFYLLLWHEISDEDGSAHPHRQITPPDMPVTVTVTTPLKSATLYVPNDSMDAAQAWQNHPSTFSLKVPDRLVILRLSPSK